MVNARAAVICPPSTSDSWLRERVCLFISFHVNFLHFGHGWILLRETLAHGLSVQHSLLVLQQVIDPCAHLPPKRTDALTLLSQVPATTRRHFVLGRQDPGLIAIRSLSEFATAVKQETCMG